jgi:hypothetical protein
LGTIYVKLVHAFGSINISKLAAFAVGILVGLSLYLLLAAGAGRIPGIALNYSLLLTIVALPFSWLTANSQSKRTKLSVFIGLFLTVGTVLILFVGLVGVGMFRGCRHFEELVFFLNLPFLVAIITVVRNRNLFVSLTAGICFGAIGILAGAHALTRVALANEIHRANLSNTCVVVTNSSDTNQVDGTKTITSVSEIPFGFIVGHRSPRIYFFAKDRVQTWSYGRFETLPNHNDPQDCEVWIRSLQ